VPVFSCGRSLYIDWRMVVVVGECPTPPHHVKREGEMSGRGKCPGKICLSGEMSYTCATAYSIMHVVVRQD